MCVCVFIGRYERERSKINYIDTIINFYSENNEFFVIQSLLHESRGLFPGRMRMHECG